MSDSEYNALKRQIKKADGEARGEARGSIEMTTISELSPTASPALSSVQMHESRNPMRISAQSAAS